MAHYAFMDKESYRIVKVIAGVDENEIQLDNGVEVGGSSEAWEQFYENQPWHSGLICKRTSYNNNIRKQYAAIDGTYNPEADVFIEPKPFDSWTLDENFDWQPPTPMPTDGKAYMWFEPNQVWIELV